MSGRFNIASTRLDGLKVVTRSPLQDPRGYLERLFCAHDLAEAGVDWTPVQVNRTFTRHKGVARGLHYQKPPHAEVKFVHCLRGGVFDVAVDLRRGSPTFGQWHGENLSAENGRALLIPQGFAHGFQTLTENVEMLYFHSAFYTSEGEAGLNLRDARLGIPWPLDIEETSERDAGLPRFTKTFEGLNI